MIEPFRREGPLVCVRLQAGVLARSLDALGFARELRTEGSEGMLYECEMYKSFSRVWGGDRLCTWMIISAVLCIVPEPLVNELASFKRD